MKFQNKMMGWLLAAVVMFSSGCVAPRHGADVPLLRMEQSLSVAQTSFDVIVKWEFDSREELNPRHSEKLLLLKPKIRKALLSADSVRLSYRSGTADETALYKSLRVVDELLSQVRFWMEDDNKAPASSPVKTSAIADTIAEAEAYRSPTPKSWITTATLLVDLGGRVYQAVNKTRDAFRQDMHWSDERSLAFSRGLSEMFEQPHWQ